MHISTRAALIPIFTAPLVLAACGSSPAGGTDTAAVSGSTSDTVTDSSSGTEASDTVSGENTTPGTGTGTGDATGSTSTGETPTTTEAVTSTTTTGDLTTGTTTTGTGETSDSTNGTTTSDTDTGTTGDTSTTGDTDTTGGNGLWDSPNLWYSVDKTLMYIELDPIDGSVVKLVANELVSGVPLHHGQNGLTMLEDGTLLGSREAAAGTQIYHVAAPPTTEGVQAKAEFLGVLPNDQEGPPLRIEALYTDCEGRIYLMDTGVNTSSAEGNRLLRFTGDFLAGVLDFEVITDLENASVGDIDDMSPGIVEGEVSDGVGFAMDSNDLWQIDYTTGTGSLLANTSGTWGVHALGGPLFADMTPRLYILSAGNANTGAELREVYLADYSDSQPLVEGPDLDLAEGYNGWSGLAGPLTECMTTIPQ